MITLTNEYITARIMPLGAELCSLFNKQSNLEYLWQAGTAWPKHSPVLFPIVGSLKNGKYIFNNNEFSLDRHGFARTKMFTVLNAEETIATFSLKADDDTKKNYPCNFELQITYKLIENAVKVICKVMNKGGAEMYFSIGAHPAFKVPLNEAHQYEDYYLQFNKTENAHRWPLDNGLLAVQPVEYLNNSQVLPLEKKLFATDALVFKNLASDIISIKNKKDHHGLDFHFSGYPFFGIWAAKDADFVCLEPWQGVTDSVLSDGMLEHKEGILKLNNDETFTCSWKAVCY